MELDEQLSYSYASKPRAVPNGRLKQRKRTDESEREIIPNIMHNPRVVRGSVFAMNSIASHARQSRSSFGPTVPKRPKKSKTKQHSVFEPKARISESFSSLPLEEYLVEQAQACASVESYSQTDAFGPRLITNQAKDISDGPFHRPKVGVDTSTQIQDSDQLFNFDKEVEPLLHVLVNKTMAQALVELKQETEMVSLESDHRIMVDKKAENARAERELEQKAVADYKEKERMKAEKEKKIKQRKKFVEKLAAWQYSKAIIPHVIKETIRILERNGVFYDPIQRDLEVWLVTTIIPEVSDIVDMKATAMRLLDGLIENTLRKENVLSYLLKQEDAASVRLLLQDPLPGHPESMTTIGPIDVSRTDSLSAIEGKLQSWIAENLDETVVAPPNGYLSILPLAKVL